MAAIPIVLGSACGGDDSDDGSSAAVAETTRTTSPPTGAAPGTTGPPSTIPATTVPDPMSPDHSPAPTTTPPTTTPPTTATTTATTPEPVDLSTLLDPSRHHVIGYVADPGVYRSDRLGVEVEITLEERLQYINLPGHLSFVTYDATNRNPIGVFIHEVIGYVPAEDMAMPHEPGGTDEIDPFTGSFDDWFGTDARVVVTGTGTDTIAGAPAPWWDLEVDPAAGETFRCLFGDCVTFIVDPRVGATNMGDDWQFRLWHLTAFENATIVAFMESTPDRLEDTLDLADRLLATLRVTTGHEGS